MKAHILSVLILFAIVLSWTAVASAQETTLRGDIFVRASWATARIRIIEKSTRTVRSYGSGVVISPDGLVITNAHLFASDSPTEHESYTDTNKYEHQVILSDISSGAGIYDATIIHCGVPFEKLSTPVSTLTMDLAVLRISPANAIPFLGFLPLTNTNASAVVCALGFPGASEIESLTVNYGHISRIRRSSLYQPQYIEHDAASELGISGGPLVNLKGGAIGICCGYEGVETKIAIASDVVIELLKELKLTAGMTILPCEWDKQRIDMRGGDLVNSMMFLTNGNTFHLMAPDYYSLNLALLNNLSGVASYTHQITDNIQFLMLGDQADFTVRVKLDFGLHSQQALVDLCRNKASTETINGLSAQLKTEIKDFLQKSINCTILEEKSLFILRHSNIDFGNTMAFDYIANYINPIAPTKKRGCYTRRIYLDNGITITVLLDGGYPCIFTEHDAENETVMRTLIDSYYPKVMF